VDKIVIHRKITADLRFKWQTKFTEIGRRALTFCPEFPAVGRRWDKWWSFQSERPLLVASAKKRKDIYWGKGLHLLDQPKEWLKIRRLQVENTHYVGEALPSIRVDIGPVSIGAFLGAPLHLSEETQTVWQENIPAITALQYTPGAGTPCALAKLEMLKMFQQAGKPVFVVCPKGEVEELADRLDPRGLVLMPVDVESPREADELFEIIVKMYP